jgi:putative membrane protein
MPSEEAPADRRLHPVSLLFIIGALARSLLLPGIVVLAFASRRGDPEVWLMIVFVPALVASLVRYGTYRYRLDPDELVIREGILFRNERHVPYARIQNIDLQQNPLHRAFGVAQVRIETAGGARPEATMRVLSLAAVEHMRQRVFAGPRGATAAAPGEAGAESAAGGAEPAWRLLHWMDLREVVLFGLISNKGMVVVAALVGVLWQADLMDRWIGALSRQSLERYRAMLPRSDAASTILLGLAALVLLLLLMRLLSVAWAVFTLYGFRLRRSGDDLRAEYGLWSRVTETVPRRRIQVLSAREGFLHRRLGRAAVQIETAGSHGEPHGAVSDRLWLAPLIGRDRVEGLLREALPGVEPREIEWRPLAPNARRRRFRLALAASVPLIALCVWVFGVAGTASAAVLGPLAWINATLYVKHTKYALACGAVFFRRGWWVRRLSVARFSKIQSLHVGRSPFDRRHGMASLHVDTAGTARIGHGIDVPYLDAGVAARLMDRLSLEAARSDFRW